jgi:uncharacterized membrane protein YoaK (UPF0700 family)
MLMAGSAPSGTAVRGALLLALTFASGAIDAISYLGLGRVFTGNMTGNMILLGLAAARVQGLEALRSATAFAGFAIGVVLAARLLGRGVQAGVWPRRVTWALTIDLALLVALTAGWMASGGHPERPWLQVLIVFSGAAMGVQSAAMQRLAVPSVSTTYVTGTLTSVFMELALLGHPARGWGLRAGVVLALGVGAVLDGLVLLHWPVFAPLIPLAALAAVTATAAWAFRERS